MIHTQAFDLMQRDEDPCQEQFVFLLERERETVDYRAKDLQ